MDGLPRFAFAPGLSTPLQSLECIKGDCLGTLSGGFNESLCQEMNGISAQFRLCCSQGGVLIQLVLILQWLVRGRPPLFIPALLPSLPLRDSSRKWHWRGLETLLATPAGRR